MLSRTAISAGGLDTEHPMWFVTLWEIQIIHRLQADTGTIRLTNMLFQNKKKNTTASAAVPHTWKEAAPAA